MEDIFDLLEKRDEGTTEDTFDLLVWLRRKIEVVQGSDDPTQEEMIGRRLLEPQRLKREGDVVICALPKRISQINRLVCCIVGELALKRLSLKIQEGSTEVPSEEKENIEEDETLSEIFGILGEVLIDCYFKLACNVRAVRNSPFQTLYLRDGNVEGINNESPPARQSIRLIFREHGPDESNEIN